MSTAKQDLEELRKQQEALLTSEKRSLWLSTEDLDKPSAPLEAERGQEFAVLPVHKELAEDAAVETVSLGRRRFLQFSAAASTLISTAACTRRPVDHLVPYTKKPQGLTYGVPMWYASSASNGYGVLVKTREGKPIKLEGNPDHPVNQGGLDAQTQASLFDLYNPERLRNPVDVKAAKATTWEAVDAEVKKAVSAAAAGSVRVLTGPIVSPSTKQALRNFLNATKGVHHIHEDVPTDPIARAMEMVTGQAYIPSFRFDKADVVVSVDADFLGTWLRPVEFTKQFSKKRALHDGLKDPVRLYCFESAHTATGIAADYRQTIVPSQQLGLLLALGSEIVKQKSADSNAANFLSRYSSEKLGAELGFSAELVRQAAQDLSAARGKSLVVAGGRGTHALEVQLATIMINAALGNFGETLEVDRAMLLGTESGESSASLIADMKAGRVDVLVIQGTNPVYSNPSADFQSALSKVKLTVVVTSEMNETSSLASYALPESHYLEAWGDSEIREGVHSIQQPVIEPLYSSKSLGEILLAWSGSELKSFRDFVAAAWQKNFSAVAWNDHLKIGAYTAAGSRRGFGAKWAQATNLLERAQLKSSAGLELVLYTNVALGSGASANNPYLQELPDPVTKVTWDNYIGMSPALAAQLGVNQGKSKVLDSDHRSDLCEISVSGAPSLTLPVFVQSGLSEKVVVVALGYGRKVAGSIGSNVGKNAAVFFGNGSQGEVQLRGQSVSVKKVSGRYELACTQKQFDLQGRDSDILQQHTLKDFLAMGDGAHGHGGKKHEVFSIYNEKEFVYPGQKWGMAVDLNKCTGCNACVVACYTENNVSTVGREQVIMGRHQAWLRLDLYHSGNPENPDSAFEPMMCQHCDKAPCETVCPVLATVHSTDGLNDMSYNRCVGTRYCANNCPYKVRRFNWFQFSDKLANAVVKEDPLPMMINPDVSVRTRGVMEKCTFCVQRIRSEVPDRMARIKDGSIKTACQQSCPADAISFGDLNDPESRVSEMAKKGSAFKVLEVLNTRPNVTYLPRVRNKESAV